MPQSPGTDDSGRAAEQAANHPASPPPDGTSRSRVQPGGDSAGVTTELFGGRFVDVERGELHPAATRMLIRAGRIEALLPPDMADEAPDRGSRRRVDLRGRTVVPGLANTHVHLQIVVPSLLPGLKQNRLARRLGWEQRYRNVRECTLRGVTTIREALTADLRRTETLRRHGANAQPRGPRILQSVLVAPLGGVFSPEQGLGQRGLDWVTGMPTVPYDAPYCGVVVFPAGASASVVRSAVDRAIDERGADAIKLYDQRERLFTFRPTATLMTQTQLDAATDQCRKRGVVSTMHHLTVESFRRAVRAGVRSVAHLPSDARLTEDDVQGAKRSGLVVEPTVSLLYALCWRPLSGTDAERARLHQLTALRNRTASSIAAEHWHPSLAPSFLDGLARSQAGRTALLGGLYDLKKVYGYYGGLLGHGIDNLERLLRAGVPLACGTDAGAIPCTPAMVGLELTLWRELFGERAVSPALALRAATVHAATAMGLPDPTGRLVPGAIADLVAYDRNPLTEPGVLGEHASAVWRDGELLLDRMAPPAPTPSPSGSPAFP